MTIPRDKQIHAAAGFAIALLTAWMGRWLSVALVLVAAVGKEAYDYLHPDKHTCDIWDAVATVTGAVPVWILWGLL